MKKSTVKKSVLLIVSIFIFLNIVGIFFIGPSIKVVNKTGFLIGVSNLQYIESNREPTREELYSIGSYKLLKSDQSYTARLYKRNWFVNKSIAMDINAIYRDEVKIQSDESVRLQGATFNTTSPKLNDKRNCGYKVYIYDFGTIIEPMFNICFRSFYNIQRGKNG